MRFKCFISEEAKAGRLKGKRGGEVFKGLGDLFRERATRDDWQSCCAAAAAFKDAWDLDMPTSLSTAQASTDTVQVLAPQPLVIASQTSIHSGLTQARRDYLETRRKERAQTDVEEAHFQAWERSAPRCELLEGLDSAAVHLPTAHGTLTEFIAPAEHLVTNVARSLDKNERVAIALGTFRADPDRTAATSTFWGLPAVPGKVDPASTAIMHVGLSEACQLRPATLQCAAHWASAFTITQICDCSLNAWWHGAGLHSGKAQRQENSFEMVTSCCRSRFSTAVRIQRLVMCTKLCTIIWATSI